MGVSQLGQLARKLGSTALGYPGDIPVGIVERASRADQRVTKTRLDEVAAVAKQRGIAAPAVIVIGNVVTCLDED